ncbi:hypothetical protein F511_17709 [Dorcoceras hygrometricum]|uniref:DNA replication complex GINS protein PSF3 N-terminal domain-containing protein n=1 Tax=Dorcoceras hygrometricum TaxID=472368 RepID=A0A2Z7C093_9LAMI|nr:hypothetical protein F511_17709 [Dorcoceras hygrometricum]
MASYYDVDDILAEDELVPSVFQHAANGVGLFDSSDYANKVEAASRVELPFWLVGELCLRHLVTIRVPPCFDKESKTREEIGADAAHVDLRSRCRYFYSLGCKIAPLVGLVSFCSRLCDWGVYICVCWLPFGVLYRWSVKLCAFSGFLCVSEPEPAAWTFLALDWSNLRSRTVNPDLGRSTVNSNLGRSTVNTDLGRSTVNSYMRRSNSQLISGTVNSALTGQLSFGLVKSALDGQLRFDQVNSDSAT